MSLLATPVFSNLRRMYPDAELHALTGTWSRVVLEKHPDVNNVVEYDSPAFCRTGQPTSLRETFKLYRQLRRQKYDLMVELRSDWWTVWFAFLRLTPKRLSSRRLTSCEQIGFCTIQWDPRNDA